MSVIIRDSGQSLLLDYAKVLGGIDTVIYKSANQVKNKIVKRTRSGVDSNGTPFEPYSKGYKSYRRKHNRKSSPVTLTYTGNMLNSAIASRSGSRTKIHLPQASENKKAGWHHFGKGNNPVRRFFELSEQNIDFLMNSIVNAFKRRGL